MKLPLPITELRFFLIILSLLLISPDYSNAIPISMTGNTYISMHGGYGGAYTELNGDKFSLRGMDGGGYSYINYSGVTGDESVFVSAYYESSNTGFLESNGESLVFSGHVKPFRLSLGFYTGPFILPTIESDAVFCVPVTINGSYDFHLNDNYDDLFFGKVDGLGHALIGIGPDSKYPLFFITEFTGTMDYPSVPEPGSVLLFGSGILGLAVVCKINKRLGRLG